MPSGIFRTVITGISSTTGYNSSQVYFPDWMVRPFNIGIGCVLNSTSQVYTVEHSFDYTGGSSTWRSSNATWFASSGITAQTSNQSGSYSFPVTAIRVQSSAGSSIGTVTMTVIQAG